VFVAGKSGNVNDVHGIIATIRRRSDLMRNIVFGMIPEAVICDAVMKRFV
jgi:hypothetical protein